MTIDYALSNSFGFGGTNAALLFKKYESWRSEPAPRAGMRDVMKIAVCIKQVADARVAAAPERRQDAGSASRTPATR